MGTNAQGSGANAIAIGTNAQATQSGSIAMGMNAASTGANAIAIGTNALATGSIAVGNAASAANGGAAFGDAASATTTNAVAVGQNASVAATNGTALGANAVVQAAATNAVAIGQGSVASAPNTVSFGSPGNERRLTNVAAGIAPTDAVNVGQLNALQDQVVGNQKEARRGIAATAALASAMTPSAPGKTTVSLNSGFFHGEAGVGVAVAHRLNLAVPLIVHGSYASAAGTEHVGRAGLAFEF
jgi:autotransporter adhesin